MGISQLIRLLFENRGIKQTIFKNAVWLAKRLFKMYKMIKLYIKR